MKGKWSIKLPFITLTESRLPPSYEPYGLNPFSRLGCVCGHAGDEARTAKKLNSRRTTRQVFIFCAPTAFLFAGQRTLSGNFRASRKILFLLRIRNKRPLAAPSGKF